VLQSILVLTNLKMDKMLVVGSIYRNQVSFDSRSIFILVMNVNLSSNDSVDVIVINSSHYLLVYYGESRETKESQD